MNKEECFEGKSEPGDIQHSHFCYSDGDEIENRLLRIVRDTKDVSISSDELRSSISDWPSEYHLGVSRHNLLRPFIFGPQHSILELGCGCGAITRQLGESGASVLAVDGSERRIRITLERCRDLVNVKAKCVNLVDFESAEKFDFVMLIGVLEYARMFISSESDPIDRCLRTAKRFLRKGGVMFLAIENQLGLKYFNGCSEDHVGIPFFGINDLYDQKTAVTFGKSELVNIIKRAGFEKISFYYPFPDYKVPSVIISDRALDDSRVNIEDLLIRTISRDYSAVPMRLFNENLALGVLRRNKLVGDMANSFLILAEGKESDNKEQSSWLVKSYNTSRIAFFATENSLEERNGELVVNKKKIFVEKTPNIGKVSSPEITHQIFSEKYIEGKLLFTDILSNICRGGTLADIADWIRPWIDFLKAKSIALKADVHCDNASRLFLPADYIDCVPFNLIRNSNGHLVYFDAEWVSSRPVPFLWVVARGLVHMLRYCPVQEDIKNLTYREITAAILAILDINISQSDYHDLEKLEDALHFVCSGGETQRKNIYFADMLDQPLYHIHYYYNPEVEKRKAAKDDEIKLLNSQLMLSSTEMEEKNAEIKSLGSQLMLRSTEIEERDERINFLNSKIIEKNQEIIRLRAIEKSASWRAISGALNFIDNRILPFNSKRSKFLRPKIGRLYASYNVPVDAKGTGKNIIRENSYEDYPAKGSGASLKKILFLTTILDWQSKRYRVYNLIEELTQRGVECIVFLEDVINLQFFEGADLLIVFRVPLSDKVGNIIEHARKEGMPTVFDVDDLIFVPECVKYFDGLNHMPKDTKKSFLRNVPRWRDTMLMCDAVTCSTGTICNYATELGKKAYVISNTISHSQIYLAKQILEKKKDEGAVKIGYFSGSKTHHKDFEEVSDALYDILINYSDTEFHLIGELILDQKFSFFGDRVVIQPLMPHLEYLEYMSKIDINLAPLELNNPFTDSKSELKIFEAGLLEVPTIASPAASYKQCISDGVDGYLAATRREWYEKLSLLIQNPSLRIKIGRNAREHFIKRFYIKNVIGHVIQIYEELVSRHKVTLH